MRSVWLICLCRSSKSYRRSFSSTKWQCFKFKFGYTADSTEAKSTSNFFALACSAGASAQLVRPPSFRLQSFFLTVQIYHSPSHGQGHHNRRILELTKKASSPSRVWLFQCLQNKGILTDSGVSSRHANKSSCGAEWFDITCWRCWCSATIRIGIGWSNFWKKVTCNFPDDTATKVQSSCRNETSEDVENTTGTSKWETRVRGNYRLCIQNSRW